jgi:hypothetical protein
MKSATILITSLRSLEAARAPRERWIGDCLPFTSSFSRWNYEGTCCICEIIGWSWELYVLAEMLRDHFWRSERHELLELGSRDSNHLIMKKGEKKRRRNDGDV